MNDKLVAEIDEELRPKTLGDFGCDTGKLALYWLRDLQRKTDLLQRARDALPVWVPVSEGLPKGSGWYLVRIANYSDTAWYWDAQEEFDTGDEKLPKVTHWMTLPTPPTDKGDG